MTIPRRPRKISKMRSPRPKGSPKRVLFHSLNRTLIRNDHPQTPAQNLENEVSEAQGVTKKGFVSFSE